MFDRQGVGGAAGREWVFDGLQPSNNNIVVKAMKQMSVLCRLCRCLGKQKASSLIRAVEESYKELRFCRR